MPRAASTPIEPVEMAGIPITSRCLSRMIEPFPNCRSICDSAVSAALSLSDGIVAMSLIAPSFSSKRTIHFVGSNLEKRDEFVLETSRRVVKSSVRRGFEKLKNSNGHGQNPRLFRETNAEVPH